jgi:uncharacterized protein (UPF0335 family)
MPNYKQWKEQRASGEIKTEPETDKCDKEVFEKGTHIMSAHGGSAKILNHWIKSVQSRIEAETKDLDHESELYKKAYAKLDWHYIGGIAIIKCLAATRIAEKEAILELVNAKPESVIIDNFFLSLE